MEYRIGDIVYLLPSKGRKAGVCTVVDWDGDDLYLLRYLGSLGKTERTVTCYYGDLQPYRAPQRRNKTSRSRSSFSTGYNRRY